jgi:hypothetical protein
LLTCCALAGVSRGIVHEPVDNGPVPDHDASVVLGEASAGKGLGVGRGDDPVGPDQDCVGRSATGYEPT